VELREQLQHVINEIDIYLILELEKPETYLFIMGYGLYLLYLNTAARTDAMQSNYYN
jgi:hypothetical protein